MTIFYFFSKNIHRIVLIRLVLENWRSQLSLGCFPIEFGQFFMFLCDFEKNRYFGGMAKLLYTGSQTCAPLTKSKTSTRPTFRSKYFLLCVKWHSNFLLWIAWNSGILRSMLKKFLQRLETFLGHFEVILFKSQKSFCDETHLAILEYLVTPQKSFLWFEQNYFKVTQESI